MTTTVQILVAAIAVALRKNSVQSLSRGCTVDFLTGLPFGASDSTDYAIMTRGLQLPPIMPDLADTVSINLWI